MKKCTTFFVCCLVTILTASSVFAQQGGFNGPGDTNGGQNGFNGPTAQLRAVTVSQLSTLPHKSYVTLTGNITQSLGRKYYTFRDSTGEITVEIEQRAWWGVTAGPSDRVEITVEVENKGYGRMEVEVYRIRKL